MIIYRTSKELRIELKQGEVGNGLNHIKRTRTYLNILKTILLPNTPQHVLLAALLHLSREQQLIEYKIRLLEVEDEIQLAHVAVVLVHLLDVAVHNLQRDQLVVRAVAAGNEEEGGVAPVDYLGVCEGVVLEGRWRVGVAGGTRGRMEDGGDLCIRGSYTCGFGVRERAGRRLL